MANLNTIKQNLKGQTTEFIGKYRDFLNKSQFFVVDIENGNDNSFKDIENILSASLRKITISIGTNKQSYDFETSKEKYNTEQLYKELSELIEYLTNNNIERIEYNLVTQIVLQVKSSNSDGGTSYIESDFFDNFILATKEQLLEFINFHEKNNSIEEYKNYIICFYKILEHTSLANMQFNELYLKSVEDIQKLNQSVEKTKNSMNEWFEGTSDYLLEAESRVSEVSTTIKDLEKKYKNLNIEIVSVLGIFSSIIFAVFGGVSQLGALGGAMQKVGLNKIFIFIGASSFVLQSLVFMSFNATALLTERDIRACGCIKGDKCKHGFTERYPVYTYASLFSLSIFLLGCCLALF